MLERQHIIYHTGNLATDRNPEFSKLTRSASEKLGNIADNYWNEANNGNGILIQEKISRNEFNYIFIKKEK